MQMIYNVKDKPKFGQLIVFAFQQLLAIMAATIAVPMIVGNGMSTSAALFGAGVGTLVYVLFTKAKSPVFLGSSFAFLGSMATAFAGAATAALGYLGLIIGAVLAGLVYVVLAAVVKGAGVKWINKLMPAVVIGPTVAIIGLSLAGNAVGDLQASNIEGGSNYVAIICGIVTLAVVMLCSVYGKKMARLIPFIIGILAGYAVATCFYFIGKATGNTALMVIDYSALVNNFKEISFSSFISVPDFTFLTAFGGFKGITGSYIGTIAVAYIPVAFVVFAEHIADHKNLSSIIEHDLLEDPGLSRTLLGDGVGSMVGAFFGGCPNTTYGESVGCVAITKNASVTTIICTAVEAMLIAFITPFVAFLSTIPHCVMGGVCIALYGFIAVSGLKMLQKVDLDDNRNLFTASVILIAGVGGLALNFGNVTITEVACALILGILTNVMLSKKSKDAKKSKK
ncbi:solute carrier family 23 protein [uncultured Ruminococcus sp.]|uniref:uracil-xanthine permease family protein n=1 Tax=uncultured Ruminococcus sp. TaxID=165186 RepID=UPI00292CD6E8|nr:solute carrier family 23 protein [uncultured Ruminococcus sp.]